MAKPIKPASPPPVQAQDLHNLVLAARQALPNLSAESLAHVAASIQRIEAALVATQTAKPATDGQAAQVP